MSLLGEIWLYIYDGDFRPTYRQKMARTSKMTQGVAPIKHSRARMRDGREVHIAMSGTKGPKLLLVHGYIDSWRSFERMFPFLSDDFLLVAVDQRGHGETDQADDYAIADFVADVIDLIKSKSKVPVHL